MSDTAGAVTTQLTQSAAAVLTVSPTAGDKLLLYALSIEHIKRIAVIFISDLSGAALWLCAVFASCDTTESRLIRPSEFTSALSAPSLLMSFFTSSDKLSYIPERSYSSACAETEANAVSAKNTRVKIINFFILSLTS